MIDYNDLKGDDREEFVHRLEDGWRVLHARQCVDALARPVYGSETARALRERPALADLLRFLTEGPTKEGRKRAALKLEREGEELERELAALDDADRRAAEAELLYRYGAAGPSLVPNPMPKLAEKERWAWIRKAVFRAVTNPVPRTARYAAMKTVQEDRAREVQRPVSTREAWRELRDRVICAATMVGGGAERASRVWEVAKSPHMPAEEEQLGAEVDEDVAAYEPWEWATTGPDDTPVATPLERARTIVAALRDPVARIDALRTLDEFKAATTEPRFETWVLRELERRPYVEIGVLVGRTPGAARKLACEARADLRNVRLDRAAAIRERSVV